MADFWCLLWNRRSPQEQDARQNVAVARAALNARKRDLQARIGERDASIAKTFHDILPGSRHDDDVSQ